MKKGEEKRRERERDSRQPAHGEEGWLKYGLAPPTHGTEYGVISHFEGSSQPHAGKSINRVSHTITDPIDAPVCYFAC